MTPPPTSVEIPVADKDAVYSRFFADVQMYATGPDIDPQLVPRRPHL